MENIKPRFKNSFGVTGTIGEIMHFKEIATSMGWHLTSSHDGSKAMNFHGNNGHFWNTTRREIHSIDNVSLSHPEGWQLALFLVEEKEEEVPEYVEAIRYNCPGSQFTCGKIYKVHGFKPSGNYWLTSDNGNENNGWHKDNLKPSTKEAFTRQELLQEAQNRGYKRGVKVKSSYFNNAEFIIRNGVFYYESVGGLPSLIDNNDCNGNYIYYQGKWSEIIDESTPSKEEIERVLNHLKEITK